MPDPASTSQVGAYYAVACAFTWSIAVVLFRKSGDLVPPVALNLFKGVVGFTGLGLTALVLGLRVLPDGVSPTDALLLFLSGMVGIGIADTLFFLGLNRIGAGPSAIVSCLYSPAVWLFSAALLDEPLTGRLWITLGLMSLAILLASRDAPSQGPVPQGRGDRGSQTSGILYSALSVVLMAAAIVGVKPILDASDPWWAGAVRMGGGVTFLAVQGLLPSHRPSVRRAFTPGAHWKVLLPGALIGSYLAMYLWIAGMKYTQTNIASILNQSSTLFTLILATLFLKERLTVYRVLALLLGFTGVLLVVQGT